MSEIFERLPTFAKPEHYSIYLEPDIREFTANGRVDILIDFVEPSDFVKLHFGCYELKSAKMILANGKEWIGLKFNVDRMWNTVKVNFPMKLEPQKAKLSLVFDNKINSGLEGFYRSSYKDKAGNTKFMACTQFESESARLAFPCFDEPMFKAKFDVELLVDENLTALSNMNVISEEKRDGVKKLVKFATTPIMSTYLMAFIVGELEFVETHYGNNIPLRVYTVPGKSHESKYALKVAKCALNFMEEWFDLRLPLPKTDLIGIPDFSMGAMENFGLVTFRDILMIYNDQTSHLIKMRSASVIYHELAHFWFGNIVTMKWWNDLWLKEGFASFCQYVFLDKNHPELKAMLDYLPSITNAGMKADEIRNSHSIEVKINQPCDLASYYDDITYQKSNACILMLYKYLGEQVFRDGLRLYIKKFAYSNAETQDLWNALGEASGQNINEIMGSWTKQMGFPLIVVKDEKLDVNKRRIHVKQMRYLADGTTDGQLWQIPFTFVKASSPNEPFYKLLFTQREQTIELDGIGENEWIKLNYATSGFYRVQYSKEMFESLLNGIRDNKMIAEDRYGLASDLVALIGSGHVSADQFLTFLAALANENEYIVWAAAANGLRLIGDILDSHDRDLKLKFDRFAISILERVASRLGWICEKGEDPHRNLLRSLIMGLLIWVGHKESIDVALKLFNEYVSGDINAINPEMRLMIFIAAAKNHPDALAHLFKIYETSNSPEIQCHCIISLSLIGNNADRKKVFENGILEKKFRSQDIMYMFMHRLPSGGSVYNEFVWSWFKENYQILIEYLGGRPNIANCTHCVKAVLVNQSSEKFATEAEQFYESLDENIKKAWSVRFKEGLERARLNAKFHQNQYKSIADFLAPY